MLVEAITWLMTVRRFVWRACYGALAKRVPTPDWAFMNYGYAARGGRCRHHSAACSRPMSVIGCASSFICTPSTTRDLRGKDVLEVGSGRGGGASYISRYLQPRADDGDGFLPGSRGHVQPAPPCPRL